MDGALAGGFGEHGRGLGQGFGGGRLVAVGDGEAHGLHGIAGASAGGAVAAGMNKALAVTLEG